MLLTWSSPYLWHIACIIALGLMLLGILVALEVVPLPF